MNDPSQSSYSTESEQLLAEISAGIPQPPRPKRHTRTIVITIAILLIIGIAIALSAIPRSNCLTQDDLTELTGASYSGNFDSTQSFYDYVFDFVPNKLTYDPGSTEDYASNIQTMATFYSTHKDKLVRFTIRSYERTTDNASLSNSRQQALRDQLIQSGIPSKFIHTSSSEAITGLADGEHSDESMDSMTVSITSDSTCRQ